jgi:hypothetical protein
MRAARSVRLIRSFGAGRVDGGAWAYHHLLFEVAVAGPVDFVERDGLNPKQVPIG